MIWHLIKYWASFFIPTFYKRIQGHNVQRLNVKGPVIIAMNHPNAFTDPIAITYVSYPLRVHYMARGDAFKPGIIAWLRWGETPDLTSLIGAGLIFSASLLSIPRRAKASPD